MQRCWHYCCSWWWRSSKGHGLTHQWIGPDADRTAPAPDLSSLEVQMTWTEIMPTLDNLHSRDRIPSQCARRACLQSIRHDERRPDEADGILARAVYSPILGFPYTARYTAKWRVTARNGAIQLTLIVPRACRVYSVYSACYTACVIYGLMSLSDDFLCVFAYLHTYTVQRYTPPLWKGG